MDEHQCHYCNRQFSCKTALNKHKFGSCLWLHTSRKEKLYEIDDFEPNMTNTQKDHLLRTLLLQVTKLNEQVGTLKRKVTQLEQHKKVSILQFLNTSSKKPEIFLQPWLRELVITQRHLELVFKKSLKEGMLQVLLDDLEGLKMFQKQAPIKSYTQNPKILYVYSDSTSHPREPRWMKLDFDLFKQICANLASRFYGLYIEWQSENQDYLSSSPEAQDQDILFMQKMLDESYKTHPYMNFMVERIHDHIKIQFESATYE
jgi:hypothetical protein